MIFLYFSDVFAKNIYHFRIQGNISIILEGKKLEIPEKWVWVVEGGATYPKH